MAEKRISHEVTLDTCGHRALFQMNYPRTGEVILCYRCGVGRVVSSTRVCYWEAACLSCDWRVTSGQRRQESLKFGQWHANQTGHKVNVTSPAGVLHKCLESKYEQIELELPAANITNSEIDRFNPDHHHRWKDHGVMGSFGHPASHG